MKKSVKSTDPRKPYLLDAFKEVTGATKVTNVVEVGENQYTANCFKHVGNRKYEELGTHTIEFQFPTEKEEELEPVLSGVNIAS